MASALAFISAGVRIRVHAEEPAIRSGLSKRPAILLLHGSGGHVDFWTARLAPFLAEAGIALYAPHYFERTGTTRADLNLLTDGRHVPQWLETVDDALRFVSTRPGVDPEKIIVTGISLGAFLGLALAAQLSSSRHEPDRRRIFALLDISGGLVPPYDAQASSAMPPTLLLHGAVDTIVLVSFAEDLDRKLDALHVPHRTVILPGEGHWFSAAAMPRLLLAVSSFLQEHLQPARGAEATDAASKSASLRRPR